MEVNKVLVELEQLLVDKADYLEGFNQNERVIRVEDLCHFITAHTVQPEDGSGGLG